MARVETLEVGNAELRRRVGMDSRKFLDSAVE
jgi:hypothetical protein